MRHVCASISCAVRERHSGFKWREVTARPVSFLTAHALFVVLLVGHMLPIPD